MLTGLLTRVTSLFSSRSKVRSGGRRSGCTAEADGARFEILYHARCVAVAPASCRSSLLRCPSRAPQRLLSLLSCAAAARVVRRRATVKTQGVTHRTRRCGLPARLRHTRLDSGRCAAAPGPSRWTAHKQGAHHGRHSIPVGTLRKERAHCPDPAKQSSGCKSERVPTHAPCETCGIAVSLASAGARGSPHAPRWRPQALGSASGLPLVTRPRVATRGTGTRLIQQSTSCA